MKKNINRFLQIVLSTIMALFVFTGCNSSNSTIASDSTNSSDSTESTTSAQSEPAKSLGTVKIGIQANHPWLATLCMTRFNYDEQFNFKSEITTSTGPNLYAALSTGNLDVAYLGNGVAWHYFEKDAVMDIAIFDGLTNDENLLLRKDIIDKETDDITYEDLYQALKGKTLAVDIATSSGNFLKTLINHINEGKDDSEKLWFEYVEGPYPFAGSDEMEINILNSENKNIPSAMYDKSIDGAIAFSSQRVQLQDTGDFCTAATPFTHISDSITPATWAVNREWKNKNPELYQAFLNALLLGMEYRSLDENSTDCREYCAKIDQVNPEDYVCASLFLGYDHINEYFQENLDEGYQFIKQIRDSHVDTNGLTDENMRSIEDVIDIEAIQEALKVDKEILNK